MNYHDDGEHPSHKAFCAGIQFVKDHPNAPTSDADQASREYDDRQAFLDGYWEALSNKEDE